MKKIIFAAVLALLGSFALPAFAYSPTLSINNAGGDNYSLIVSNAFPNSSIQLSYTVPGSSLPTTIGNFGYTNNSGYYTATVSGNSYGISGGGQVYVTIGGERSNTVTVGGGTGCYYNCGSNLSLSQTSLNISTGQSASVTAYNYNSGLYISGNTNPYVATASLSGNQINVYGSTNGTTTINVCASGMQCASLYVTVGYGSGSGSLSISQTNLSINYGQSAYVTVYNYSGSVYVSNNSNPSVVSVSVSGNQITLYGQNQGSSTVMVCAANNQCASIYVSVGSSSGGSLGLSQTSLTMNIGQSSSVYATNISGGSVYVSQNTNPGIVSAYASGGIVNFSALALGSSTVTICGNNNMCGTVSINVTGGGSTGILNLSQTALTLNNNQNGAITIYSGSGASYYIAGNTSPHIASATVSGNIVNVYGYGNTGSTSISICQNGTSQCGTLYVTVNSNNNNGNVRLTTSSLPGMTVGQYYSAFLQATGGNAPYTYTVSSGSLPAGLSLSSNGQISGTPQNTSPASFWVRVQDQYGQNATMNFYVTVSGSGSVLGTNTYTNGTLISENGTVYMVYKNTKNGFSSSAVFKAFGFKFENVAEVGDSGLTDLGYVIRSSNTSHPWGAWVKSGKAVYFVHEDGLIPVPDMATFLNNGGQISMLVSANSRDLSLPRLSALVMNDARLR